jgi:hypothetical protein
MTDEEIIIEISNRLADEPDYDENLKPKLERLLELLESINANDI